VTINERSIQPRDSLFDAQQVLQFEVEKLVSLANRRHRRFTVSLAQVCAVIFADRDLFSFIIRNLLRNAIKHGLEGPVYVSSRVLTGGWSLRIENLGTMTVDEDRLKFVARARVLGWRSDGLHIGLAASKSWCDWYGAKLYVRNGERDGREVVVAELLWPMTAADHGAAANSGA
jgi:signal transduction histidine kinase